MIEQGDWTCTIHFAGTMTGLMAMADGAVIAATNQCFKVDFCTVARSNENGETVEKTYSTISIGMLKQIGGM